MNPTPVAILGGGPIGLAAALLLARAGCAPTVFDARTLEAARSDRRLLALSRGTWQALAPLLGAQLPPRAPIVDVYVSSAGEFGATHIGTQDFGAGAGSDAEPALGATVYYGELLAALAAAVAAQPAIRVQRPVRVLDMLQRNAEVEVVLDGATAGTAPFSAALGVHAEGAPARDAAHTAPDAWALVCDLQLHGPAPGAAYERFTREGPLALLPAPAAAGPRWSLVWCMDEAQAARRAGLADDAFRAELQQAIGARIARVESATARRAVRLPQQARARITEHRVVWLGNAAQTLHPVAGQGFNLGLRDCLTLADCLQQMRDDVPAALLHYARRRAGDRALIGQLTRWMPPLFATRFAPAALARTLGLTAMDLLPPLRREWARLLMFGVRN